MTDLEEKAKEYFVKDCVEYDEDEYICENFEKAIKDAYKKGYNTGAEEIENAHQEEIENLYKSYAEKLAQQEARIEKQKEINYEYVDKVDKLKQFVWGCMHEKSYSMEELNKLMEL